MLAGSSVMVPDHSRPDGAARMEPQPMVRPYRGQHMDTAIPSDLLGQARAGDRDAFDALLGPLIDPAFRLAHGLLHDRAGAEDAVQEAAVRAWRHLGNVRP